MFLGQAALIERRGDRYVLRPQAGLERLLGRAYSGQIIIDSLMPGFVAITGALGIDKIGLAQIAAAKLALPDHPDWQRGSVLKSRNCSLKLERIDGRRAGIAWDEDKHLHSGMPPNLGWFAPPTGSSTAASPT